MAAYEPLRKEGTENTGQSEAFYQIRGPRNRVVEEEPHIHEEGRLPVSQEDSSPLRGAQEQAPSFYSHHSPFLVEERHTLYSLLEARLVFYILVRKAEREQLEEDSHSCSETRF